MEKSDWAGLLGLLLGGAGGYQGGKRRAAREEEQWEKFANLQRELAAMDAMEQGSTVDSIITGDDGSYIGHPGRETMAMNPYALGQGDINLVPGQIEEEKALIPWVWDKLGGGLDGNPDTFFNQGGVVPKRGLVDEPGGYAGKSKWDKVKDYVLAPTGGYTILDLIAQAGGFPGLFNEGGRVRYSEGGIVDLYRRMNRG